MNYEKVLRTVAGIWYMLLVSAITTNTKAITITNSKTTAITVRGSKYFDYLKLFWGGGGLLGGSVG